LLVVPDVERMGSALLTRRLFVVSACKQPRKAKSYLNLERLILITFLKVTRTNTTVNFELKKTNKQK